MIVDIKAYAEHVGVSAYTVGQEIRAGKIPAFKVGGQWRIDQEEADAYLKAKGNNDAGTVKSVIKYSKRKQTANKIQGDFLSALNKMRKESACGL